MLASGAPCGEAANLVDNHGGSYWVDETEVGSTSWVKIMGVFK